MTFKPQQRVRITFIRAVATAACCGAIAACSTSGDTTAGVDPELGVAASPRVVAAGEPVPDGGGRYQIGKPYQVAGKWYAPSEDPDYDRVGVASWYGDAFHGRLTANGEVFDSAAISAAHPTLPLPSYVRVTNLENDRSIIVRVNDRGPFADARLIDVSERTAEILNFKRDGMAQVRVEYVGKARLDGEDEQILLASYRGPAAVPPAAEVMLASAEPRQPVRRRPARETPVLMASAAVKPPLPPQPSAAVVAFAESGGTEGAAEPTALAAVDSVSSAYDADARIAMAFDALPGLD